ncbi:MAG TPA: hypothetical protein DD405_05760 [Desulfobacteraceae bacterium]|nr:hypothetical protein [Desulfobacteraceae bacterium]
MKLFTEEWFNAAVEKLTNDADFQKKGVGFDSNLHFKVLKDRKAKLSKDVEFGLWVPQCDKKWFGKKDPDEVDIIFEGKGGTLESVFSGKKNVVMALTMGSIKLKKGSLAKLTGNLGAVNRFIEILGSV